MVGKTDPKPYTLTAGHCSANPATTTWYEKQASDGAWHPIGGVWKQYFEADGDMAIISINNLFGWAPQGTVYVLPSNDPGYPTQPNASYSTSTYSAAPTAGSYLGHTGATTGTHCGQFQGGNKTATYKNVTVNYLGLVSMRSCQGDSGGPVYVAHSAYGIVVALDEDTSQTTAPDGKSVLCSSSNTYYQSISGAMQRLNVIPVKGP